MWTKSWTKKFREVPRFSSIRNSKDNLEFFTWIDANIILVEKLDTFCTIGTLIRKRMVTFLTVASPKLARLAHRCLHTDENPPRGEEAIRGVFREARRLHGHPLWYPRARNLAEWNELFISPDRAKLGPNYRTRLGDWVKDTTANLFRKIGSIDRIVPNWKISPKYIRL